MSCEDVRQNTFAVTDGELTDASAAAINSHLLQCGGCRARLATDAVFHHAVRAAVTVDTASPALRERITQLLNVTATENASA